MGVRCHGCRLHALAGTILYVDSPQRVKVTTDDGKSVILTPDAPDGFEPDPPAQPKVTEGVPSGWSILKEIVVHASDGTDHVFPPEFDPKRAETIVQQRITHERVITCAIFATKAFAVWAAVSIAVYGLGWSVAWVRRGFEGKAL